MKRRVLSAALAFIVLVVGTNEVAQAQTPPVNKPIVNSKVMRDATCHATSWPLNLVGKMADGSNQPRPLTQLTNRSPLPKGEIVLRVCPQQPDTTANEVAKVEEGILLVLANTTGSRHSFAASDYRLYLVQEALDSAGKWRPVESLSRSFCGNSYVQVDLEPEQFWILGPTRYTGSYKTKLRFRLIEGFRGIRQESEAPKPPIINHLSNEFEGNINPEQFVLPNSGLGFWPVPPLE